MSDLDIRIRPERHEELVGRDKVHRRVYVDPAVFDEEMVRIFSRTWIYVGHESEVASPGDFKTARIGRQPVIVSRDRDGALHVLMNRCPHRAATVCQASHGNSSTFRCEYHGWTFRNNGDLLAATFGDGYAADDLVVADNGLARAPRVDTYRGLIFANLTADGPTLLEHLGRAHEFIDLAVDLAPDGTIRLGAGSHKYRYGGNWKLQAENGVDGYHPNFVHRSFLEMSGMPGSKGPSESSAMTIFGARSPARAGSLGGGHGILDFRPLLGPMMESVLQSPEGKRTLDRLSERLGDRDRARAVLMAGGTRGFNLLVFPNLQLIGHQIRVINPRSPDITDVEMYPYLLDGMSDDHNAARLRAHEEFYGPSGGGGPDDVEIFDRVSEGLKVDSVEWLLFSRGMRRNVEDGDADWGHVTDEQPQRGFYRRWRELMGSPT